MLSAPAFLTVGIPGSPTSLAHNCWPHLSFASDERLVQKIMQPSSNVLDTILPTSLVVASDIDHDMHLGAMLVMALIIPDEPSA